MESLSIGFYGEVTIEKMFDIHDNGKVEIITRNSEDTDQEEEDDDFVVGLMPIFFNRKKAVLDFKKKIKGAKPMVITTLVNDLLRSDKISSGGARKDLWSLLNQYGYYKPSLSNWNMQVNV